MRRSMRNRYLFPRARVHRNRTRGLFTAVGLAGLLTASGCMTIGQLPPAEGLSERATFAVEPSRRLDRSNAPDSDACIVPWLTAEGEASRLDIRAACPTPDGVRWFPRGGPRGIAWDTVSGAAVYQPDWLEGRQGGVAVQIPLEGWAGGKRVRQATVELRIDDAIQPAAPTCIETEGDGPLRRFECTLVTDAFLDAPSQAGREVRSLVSVPRDAAGIATTPVRLWLHGLGGGPTTTAAGSIGIAPHDPDNTYWWGYGERDAATGAVTGEVKDYTVRQALVVLAWALENFPAADPSRVSVQGSSMGGAGALQIATHYGRHFAWADAALGQAIPRNHRPARLKTLSKFYGPPGELALDSDETSVWEQLDCTRQFLLAPESREPFFTTRHGKDDTTIHFGAAVQPSPATGLSLYAAFASQRVGHLSAWDEGGHGVADPKLGARWSGPGWDLTTDRTSRVALNRAHVAFTSASHNPEPGSMVARDGAPWHAEAGFAGNVKVAGDTHWGGDIAGVLNRGLRWQSSEMIDEVEQFEVPLRVLDGDGAASAGAGYPCTGAKLCASLPVVVDVTLRRTQAFRFAPQEPFVWRSGQQSGEGLANELGEVTVPRVEVGTSWTPLRIRRVWWHETAAALLKDGWEE